MITFESFLEAVQGAVMHANNALMDKNYDIIDKYFERVPQEEGQEDDSTSMASLKPKTVEIEYPIKTNEGMTTTKLNVPLITLVPLALSQIDHVKLDVDLVMQLVNDEVQVSFASERDKRKSMFGNPKDDKKFGRIEVVIKPHEGSEGMKIMVEGFEKALRAQIPG